MKWFLRIVGTLVLLLVIAVVVAVSYADKLVKDTVETLGPEFTRSAVTLGGVNISLLGGSAGLSDLRVGNPAGFSSADAFSLAEISVELDTNTLMSDTIVVQHVRIIAPQVTFEQSRQGSNLQALQRNIEQASDAGADKTAPVDAGGSEKKLIIKELLFSDGSIHYRNELLGDKTLDLALPDIHLTGIGEKSNGVTGAEVTEILLRELNQRAMKAVAGSAAVENLKSQAMDRIKSEQGKLKDKLKQQENKLKDKLLKGLGG